jgi:hypothetical protein
MDRPKYRIRTGSICGGRPVDQLGKDSRHLFWALVTGHHGTHWDDSLSELDCVYAITSNGRKRIVGFEPGYKDMAVRHLATYASGDIVLAIHPPVSGHRWWPGWVRTWS